MRRQKRGVAFERKIVRLLESLPLEHRLGERIGRDVGGRRLRHHAVELGRVPAHLLGRELGGKRSAGQSGGEQADLQRGYHVDRLCHPLLFVSRSEEHTSELQSLMRISYAVFCLKKKNQITNIESTQTRHKPI